MTRATIRSAVAALRFNTTSAKLAQIEDWIGQAEIAVWNAAPWAFKRVPAASLTVTAADETPAMPTDFGKATALRDHNGDRLFYLEPDVWEDRYVGETAQGVPCDYTVIDRQVYLGPIPQSAYTFKLSYRRRYSHRADGTTVTAGVMNSDNDTPLWDAEHHYILVPWAAREGIVLEDGVVPAELAALCDLHLEGMVAEHVGGEAGEVRQWGSVLY